MDSAEQPVHSWHDSYCSVSKLWRKSIKLKRGGWKARHSTATGHDIININRGDTVEETQGLYKLSREAVSQFSSSSLALALFVNYMKSNYTTKELLILAVLLSILTMMITLMQVERTPLLPVCLWWIPPGKYTILTKALLRLFKTALVFTANYT